MVLWIGFAAIAIGLLLAAFGGTRNTFGSFRGNFTQKVKGDVSQTYTETASAKPPEKSVSDGQDRFIKWTGLAIALGGFVVAAIKLLTGS